MGVARRRNARLIALIIGIAQTVKTVGGNIQWTADAICTFDIRHAIIRHIVFIQIIIRQVHLILRARTNCQRRRNAITLAGRTAALRCGFGVHGIQTKRHIVRDGLVQIDRGPLVAV